MNYDLRALSPSETRAFLLGDHNRDAQVLVEVLASKCLTLAFAESLTGGKLADTIVSVPGASAVFSGSAVTYATTTKHSVLGVDASLLDQNGAVDPQVAAQMAQGVSVRWGVDIGASATGVAGPTEQDGKPVGLVYLGIRQASHAITVFEVDFAHRNLSDCFSRLNVESQREYIRLGAVKTLYGLLLNELG